MLFREQAVRWTWREFAAQVDELAAGFLELGLQRGDRLGIWSPNRAEWLVTQFATARIGVILVNINPAYRLSELEYALNLSGCRAIVSAERLKTRCTWTCCARWRRNWPARAGRTEGGAPAGAAMGHPHGRRSQARAC